MKQIEIIVMGGMLNSVIVLLISINSHNKKLQNYLSIYICVICVYCEYAKKNKFIVKGLKIRGKAAIAINLLFGLFGSINTEQ